MSNPKPAVGILRINSENECWDGLHVVCDCGTPDHAIDIHVGVNYDRSDPQWPFTEAEFFVKMYTPWLGLGTVPEAHFPRTEAHLHWVH
jgi:hypothetical protein